MTYCLEAEAATATAPIVTPTFARDIGALVIASESTESHDQGACFFNATYCGIGMLTEEQLNPARAWDLGTSANTMKLAGLHATAVHLKVSTNVTLAFIMVLKAHVIVMNLLQRYRC